MATTAFTVTVTSAGLNIPTNPLSATADRVAMEVFNNGLVGSDIVGIYLGSNKPDLSKYVAIVLPFGSWWPPEGACVGDALWLVWLSNTGASSVYVTEYRKLP